MQQFYGFFVPAKRKRLTRAKWNGPGNGFDESKCVTIDCNIVLTTRTAQSGTVLEVTEGGVTGHESFYLKDMMAKPVNNKGLYWCAGTPCAWDSLWVSKLEMDAVLGWLKEHGVVE